ncbi:MAG: chemotaxis protein CheW [Firmicutes bacterium]|nr:chemotaxis protein CheW [Alicyclobacillaceae bacterium]MCL6497052.1 chemotaxis protein CheW [Bacillota bacterium]
MRLEEVVWGSAEERQLFRDEARELIDALESGAVADPPAIDALFRAAHTLKGSGAMVGLDEWAAAAHRVEDLLGAVRAGERPWDEAVRKAVLDLVDALRAELDGKPVADAGQGAAAPWRVVLAQDCPMPGVRAYQIWKTLASKVPEVRMDPPPEALDTWRGDAVTVWMPAGWSLDALREALQAVPDVAQIEAGPAPTGVESDFKPGRPDAGEAFPERETIRVAADTLERLLEGLGEILLDHGQVLHRALDRLDAASRASLEHLRRRALDLQEMTLKARMLPLQTLFRQYPRAVHDLAAQLGKRIRLEWEGGETELDRLVMDRLHEPLLHLLRNACDHGIEPPEVREAAGKPPEGRVRLRAWAAQGRVHIVVEDDGAGIDWEAVREKATARGWLTPQAAAAASESDLVALLLRPGVSMRDTITPVSGRGVGLDVVQAFLEASHGTLAVTSRPGQGTTFHLELPMTLAIMSALVVDVGPWTCGIPVLAVERIETAEAAGIADTLGRPVVAEGDHPLPVYALAALLGHGTPPDRAGFVVRVADGPAQAALWVDRIRGQQEVVVKPLPGLDTVMPWLNGVALLGDGTVALMLDLRRLVPPHRAERRRAQDDGVLRAGSNQMELLVFRLADGQAYGINVYKTREVQPMPPIHPVPGQHPWIVGFLRLRGETVPVVALNRALGLPEEPPAFLLITEFNQTVQAFPVQGIDRMVRVGWDAVEPLPRVLDAADGPARRFTGLIDHPDVGPIQLPDFEQILAQIVPPQFPATVAGVRPPGPEPVWLADDSRVARQQVERALAPLGVALRTFPDGQALWEAVEAKEPLPRCFVLDVEMPRLDGYTLAARLKARPETAGTPVILHTSLSGHWHAERAQAVAVDAIVTKFDAELLARTVAGLVAPARATAEAG